MSGPWADLQGSAYELPAPTWRRELTEVGRGTPMGELLRRYWQPVGLGSDASPEPRRIRVLGEDLVLFRTRAGEAGLVHERCAHRGTSLAYGRVDEAGLRCCYHGWAFDAQGRCTEQPCEPGGGINRHRVRQPWYPVQERYGLIWAYMGPPARMPVLPRYDIFESLAPGEFIEADDRSIGGGGPQILDFNWFQHWENVLDPFHVVVLHGWFSGAQFIADMQVMPQVHFSLSPYGVRTTSLRPLPDGRQFARVTGVAVPNLRLVPNPRKGAEDRRLESIGFVLPIDDTHFRIYTVARVTRPGELQGYRSRMNGKLWEELSEEEHRRFPGDYEAQKTQGDITWHSHEHLALSDRGIGMLRRLMTQQLERVAAGGDPLGLIFDPAHELVHLDEGVRVLAADEALADDAVPAPEQP